MKLDAFWAGEWQSTWEVKDGGKSLTGTLRIRCHYFEMGNMQFNLDRVFDNIPVKTPSAKDIVTSIKTVEDKVSIFNNYKHI